MFMENPLKTPGSISALGTPIDMSKVQVPAYVVAGVTDHITPWQACYQSKNILRGKIDFVLSSSGHIQSIVNPPTNPKANYFLNAESLDDPETWLAGATEHGGSWWNHWSTWYAGHGGGELPAPQILGSQTHPAGDPAPGRYVHQR
jgi:polyhydroxyalkanoate synthase